MSIYRIKSGQKTFLFPYWRLIIYLRWWLLVAGIVTRWRRHFCSYSSMGTGIADEQSLCTWKGSKRVDQSIGQEQNRGRVGHKQSNILASHYQWGNAIVSDCPSCSPTHVRERLSNWSISCPSQFITNIWKIQHDPTIWPDPDKFRSDRFLTDNVKMDVRGQNFGLIPSRNVVCPPIYPRCTCPTSPCIWAGQSDGLPEDMSFGSGLT